MEEDRVTLLQRARSLAESGADRYPNNKNILSAYAELGIEFYRLSGSFDCFDDAIRQLRKAEDNIGDPDIGRIIARYERRIAGHSYESATEVDDDE